MEIYADSNKIKETGNKIKKLSQDINNLTSELYNELESIIKTGSWQGISANNYFAQIKNDPQNLYYISNTINNYGEVLVSSANRLDNLAKKYNHE